MEDCRKCELAVYCFSEPNSWTFRTKLEMEEKQAKMVSCAHFSKTQPGRSEELCPKAG